MKSLSLTTTLLIFLPILFSSAEADCHPDDESGLLGLKAAITADPSGMLSTWKPGTDCCAWSGIKCGSDSRVTRLSLSIFPWNRSYLPLSGTIPSSVSKLSRLEGLHFIGHKNVTGPFPEPLLYLPNLIQMYVTECGFSGRLPLDLGIKLSRTIRYFDLSGNEFSGKIPPSLGNMTQLFTLQLANNKLSGTIPDEIGNIESLDWLSLEGNRLTGAIPDLSSLKGRLMLSLAHNRLTEIPSSFEAALHWFIVLDLSFNRFTGRIPEFLGHFHGHTLYLDGNKFSGPIPESFQLLDLVVDLNLSRNLLTDPLPDLSNEALSRLDLSYNKFRLGNVPNWVTKAPNLSTLGLAGCGINARMEDIVFYPRDLDLSDNKITGSVAPHLKNKNPFVYGFKARRNELSFNMSEVEFQVGFLMKFDIAHNNVYGGLPPEISRYRGDLDVSYNRLCGPIPPTNGRFPASSFQGNKCLCGDPLPPCTCTPQP